MKLWINTAIGILAGTLAALFIPFGLTSHSLIIKYSELAINIGRYIIFPLVFFSLAIAVCKLKREKKLLKTLFFSVIYIIGTTTLLVIIGVIITLIISPTRIPLIVETQTIFNLSDQVNTLMMIFPQNMFNVLTSNSNILLPLYFLSFLLGSLFYKDREISEPAFNLFDSLSRILYELNKIITNIIPLLLAGMAYNLISSLKVQTDLSMFKDLFVILIISSIVILFIVYPLILFISDKKKNPYKTLYALTGTLLTGLISGDSFFSLSMLTRESKENLKLSRKIGALTQPLSAMFGKAGTAMVTSISFLTILKSYSSLEITLYQIFWVILFSILISFTLASIPALGAYTALYMLSTMYSQTHTGHTDSYLLIKPIVPILIGFAVLIDVATSALVAILVSKSTSSIKK
ncbi:MAG: cation:dicarboxylase symporter family transporter [Spirochaetaceae bacterium]|jgi:aerobic C4-dicarboxylate transport protein|nr:cation:dicarboxylase symporter family transporter [Spirochaetaceae bacterium]